MMQPTTTQTKFLVKITCSICLCSKKNLFYLGAWTIVKYCPKNHTATATDAQNWQPHHTRAATATPMTQAMVPGSRPSKQAADEPGVVNVMGPWTTLPWL